MSRDPSRPPARPWRDPARLAVLFAAGFVSVLVFHQGMLAFLHALGIAASGPFPMGATRPFGLPQVLSLAFWGGVWGLAFAAIEPRFPKGAGYWLAALLFGALGPTFVAWFVVFPLKGLPVAGGWQASGLASGLLVNGAWGVGTALLFRASWKALRRSG